MSSQFSSGGGLRGFAFFPPIIKFLLISNVGIFLFDALFISNYTFSGQPIGAFVMRWFALWPLETGSFMPWQLVTYQFMHGSFGHVFFNMFALWMFGVELENLWGSRRFLSYYLLTGIAGGVAQMAVSYFGAEGHPVIGASGAVMGVLLAFGMNFPNRPIFMFPIFFPIPAKYFVMIYAGISLLFGMMNTADGVAHFAHLGGVVGGYLLLTVGRGLLEWVATLGQESGSGYAAFDSELPTYRDARFRDVPEESVNTEPKTPTLAFTPTRFVVDGVVVSQEQIDIILDKISLSGYNNLSEDEKHVLNEVSKQI